MSIVIWKRPERSHKQLTSLKCRWNSAHQPIVFGFQRKDLVAVPYSTGGKLSVVLPDYADYGIEKNQYINSTLYVGDTSGAYDGSGTITNVATIGLTGPDLYIDTDIDYNGAGISTWFNFFKPGYRIELTLHMFNPTTGNTKDIVFNVRPSSDGRAEVQVQNFIRSYLKKELGYNYTDLNAVDNNAWGKFTMSWREVWTAHLSEALVNDPYTYYFIDGVKYIGNDYGQNFFDYFPIASDTLIKKAKFLTMFERPTLFVDYPFSLGWIYPEGTYVSGLEIELPAIPMALIQQRKNINGANLDLATTILDSGKSPGIGCANLDTDFPAYIDNVDVHINTQTIEPLSYYESGYFAVGYFDSFPESALDTIYTLTETINVKVRNACDRSPIFIRWRNPLGHWDYWCFDANHEIEPITKDSGRYVSEPTDLETGTGRVKTIASEQTDRITCGDVIDTEDWTGLKWIEQSPCVQMLTDKTALKWLEVQVSGAGMKVWKRGSKFEVKVQFDLPTYYSVPN